MKSVYNRTSLVRNLQQTYSNPASIQANLTDPTMPQPLVDWLTELALLNGVPFNYLVPDEAMLPPESIRFFYLDDNWISALVDGAMSIGRNLTPQTDTPEMNLQRAVLPGVERQVAGSLPQPRARAFGMQAQAIEGRVVSGFVMRSSLVLDYPGMGVNVYPLHGTPSDPNPVMLPILRLEQLGPTSDTLICLVDGDAYRVDIHESPQALHYGIDCFRAGCKVQGKDADAVKNLYTFGNTTTTANGVTTNAVTMSQNVTPTDIGSCFRSVSPRVLGMDALAQRILQVNRNSAPPAGTTAPTSIDSAEMGFEMTEGVGMVSFFKSNT
jgi:hypothetical protein